MAMPSHDLVDHDGVLTAAERARLLRRLRSLFAWVGACVPEITELDGQPVRLRALLARLLDDDELTLEEAQQARRLERALRRRHESLAAELATGELTENEALERLAEAAGILRALRRLRERGPRGELAERVAQERLNDERRWLRFLRSVGRSD